jgi:hypothetical protein
LQTFESQSQLGRSLAGQRKNAEAEAHLVQGYEEMKKTAQGSGNRHARSVPVQRLSDALERLVQLYDAWGKPAEAAKWRAELETMSKPK